ncbi:ABC transporter permease [Pseudodesulfovibrio profundus]|uniref:ABC transporter permease n=1 Tax=Pseudodesulfovibrio profundus TaxID=57320 RepID=A0A2C8FEA3_9BACT|nr:ABC transporter permease [Pseudodesulfovibrio profundus]MBC16933.1 ABC transporter permease [Desulfovibrio sp.]SOB60389.1 ABC transporter permease [Pseudodesulfovibrio profundus]|tara:strand:+ start:13801 stop:14796 length:996 start_codon:yes stop_codon:yes gene_type:complete
MHTASPSFLLGKAGRLILIMGLVSVLAFTLVSLAPIDPVSAYIGLDRMQISTEQEQQIIERWGLDKPAAERFFIWAGNALQGDLGTSIIFNEPVTTVIGKRFMTSFWLMASAWTISGVLGFILGVLAGMRRDSWLDRTIRLYAYTLASTPSFWMGIVLLAVFSVSLGITPFCCATPPGVSPDDATLWQRIQHLILPAATLSVIGVAQIALHTREKTIDAMNSEYALFAFAQGESRAGVAWRHALRNVALPAVTLQFASLGELFGGSVLAEQVFAYPGLGKATVEAGIRGDVPLLLGITLFSALFVFTGNFIADMLYGVLDPRIRMNMEEAA